MKLDPRSPERHQRRDDQQTLRSAAGFLVVALILGSVLLIFDLYQDRPDYYEPARSALVEARLHLNASYDRERDLLKKVQSAHRELDAAIRFMERAEQEAPADKKELAALRGRVQALEDDQKTEQMSVSELHRRYQALFEDLDALIRKHEVESP